MLASRPARIAVNCPQNNNNNNNHNNNTLPTSRTSATSTVSTASASNVPSTTTVVEARPTPMNRLDRRARRVQRGSLRRDQSIFEPPGWTTTPATTTTTTTIGVVAPPATEDACVVDREEPIAVEKPSSKNRLDRRDRREQLGLPQRKQSIFGPGWNSNNPVLN